MSEYIQGLFCFMFVWSWPWSYGSWIYNYLYNQSCCEFETRSGQGVQHYVIKFVSDLRQVGGFLRFFNSSVSVNYQLFLSWVVIKVPVTMLVEQEIIITLGTILFYDVWIYTRKWVSVITIYKYICNYTYSFPCIYSDIIKQDCSQCYYYFLFH
jgi:hypothetical protein